MDGMPKLTPEKIKQDSFELLEGLGDYDYLQFCNALRVLNAITKFARDDSGLFAPGKEANTLIGGENLFFMLTKEEGYRAVEDWVGAHSSELFLVHDTLAYAPTDPPIGYWVAHTQVAQNLLNDFVVYISRRRLEAEA